MRLSGHFVSVATLGFLIIVNVVLVNSDAYTRRPHLHRRTAATTLPWQWRGLLLAVVTLAGYLLAQGARLAGRARGYHRGAGARHRRADDPALAFVIGSFFAGVGGSLYGHYLGSSFAGQFSIRLYLLADQHACDRRHAEP